MRMTIRRLLEEKTKMDEESGGTGSAGGAGGTGEGGTGAAGGEGGAGAAGGADLQAQIDKAVAKATSGLQTKNDELLGKLVTANEASKQFEGLDAAKIKEMINNMNQSEEAKLISEGKIDEVIERRMDRIRSDGDAKLTELTTQLAESNSNSDKYKGLFEGKTIEDTIRAEAIKNGVRTEALPDVVRRGLDTFSLSESGEVEARNKNGDLVKTKDDFILNPERFVTNLKTESPHYWPTSEGTGSQGSVIQGSNTDELGRLDDITKQGGAMDMVAYRAQRNKIIPKEK
jgi:hypothetical protein